MLVTSIFYFSHSLFYNFLVNTLESTNINQSAPNLVNKISDEFYNGTNQTELFELSALELENLPYLTLLTL